MEFQWEITSRTGEKCEGEDVFPTQEQKASANTFKLSLSSDCEIEAPYGQSIVGKSISLIVPDDSILAVKRRVTMSIGAYEERTLKYMIAFEKVN